MEQDNASSLFSRVGVVVSGTLEDGSSFSFLPVDVVDKNAKPGRYFLFKAVKELLQELST